jgi:SAM-dependent methyltransferase
MGARSIAAILRPMLGFRPRPAGRYVHPKARDLLDREGEHDAELDTASEDASGYLDWVTQLCDRHLGRRVLEVGAGVGSITAGYEHGRDVVATEISERALTALRERFAGHDNVAVVDADLRTYAPPERFDSILMVNVLEHIHDDVGALAGLGRLLNPFGNVVIYVPALNGLYGAWDHHAGHYRRYARWRLREVFEEAGFEPLEIRYVNALAVVPWMVFQGSSGADVGDSDRTGRLLRVWDRVGVPANRFVDAHLRPPLGLNVFGVARRRDGS